MKRLIMSLMLGILLVASGCETDNQIADIYASIYPIEYIAKNIVGDDLVVKSIYPRGKDVHDYELNPRDIIRVSKGKIVFYIGQGLEGLIEQSKETVLKDIPTIALSEGMDLIEINSEDVHDHEHTGGSNDGAYYDPHIWLDLEKMQIMTDKVLAEILATFELTDEQIQKFESNSNKLKEKFRELDNDYIGLLNGNDIYNKIILVDHDAYIYWEVRYNLKRIRIRNDNESTDVITKEMMEKIQLAKDNNIKYICLTKNEMVSAIANQYKNQLGIGDDGLLYLHHIATITEKEEKEGMDYLSLMKHNLDVLDKALPRK